LLRGILYLFPVETDSACPDEIQLPDIDSDRFKENNPVTSIEQKQFKQGKPAIRTCSELQAFYIT
jgi:hypothetical protein